MKVTRIETLRCDAGWRMFSFLKVMTDEASIGWSEYNESFGSARPLRRHRGAVADRDRQGSARHRAHQLPSAHADRAVARRHQSPGRRRDRERAARHQGQGARRAGLRSLRRRGAQAHSRSTGRTAAAIARAIRSCSACRGSTSYDDLSRLAEEVKSRGLRRVQDQRDDPRRQDARRLSPGIRRTARVIRSSTGRNDIVDAAFKTANAFREGGGPSLGIMMDLNFNYKTEGLSAHRQSRGAGRHDLAGDRYARCGLARADPPRHVLARSPRARRCASGATSSPSSKPTRWTSRSST